MSGLLSFDRVSLAYGGLPVVHDASLELDAGGTLGVVGESGSGKTSLAKAAVGLLRPAAGVVRFDGRDLGRLGRREAKAFRRDAQLVFQEAVAALSPRLSVRSLLAEPLRIHGLDPAAGWPAVLELVRRVGLPESALERYPHQLSGGQARRVGIARALVLRPRLLVADEPTAGLDPSVQGDILNLLADLRGEFGLTVLMVSHHLDMVRVTADRVLVLYLGRVMETGPAAAALTRPAHPYTRALLDAVPRLGPGIGLGRRAPPLAGEVPSPLNPPPGCVFHPRCPNADARCRAEVPAERPLPGGRRVACHHPLA